MIWRRTALDLGREYEHLAKADRHIAEGDQRVSAQICLIERMTERGHDTALARDLLRLLEETLMQWQAHRQLILDTLARGTSSSP